MKLKIVEFFKAIQNEFVLQLQKLGPPADKAILAMLDVPSRHTNIPHTEAF